MRQAFSLIGSSWDFLKRQPALVSVGAWMLFLPMLAIDTLNALAGGGRIAEDIRAEATIGIVLLILLLSVITIWGQCCVMVVGRRMLQTKAGRSRTSFAAVSSQAKAFVIPFILTHILRGCITLLWSLLLVVPGIVYAIRTVFSPVIIIGENTAYRAALQRSKDAVKGNFWQIVWTLFLLVAFLFVIPSLLISVAALSLPQDEPASYAAAFVASDIWIAIATILVNLSLIQMYERYRAPVPR